MKLTIKGKLKMGLVKADASKQEAKPVVKKSPAAAKPEVEKDPGAADTSANTIDTADTGKATETPAAAAPAAATGTAVAAARNTAVGSATPARLLPVLDGLKDALKVDYNTLARLQVNQGNYLLFDKNKQPLGDIIDFELLSYQDNFVCSPGSDDPKALEFVKYSNDGKITTDGRDVADYIRELKEEGWEKASLKPRCVLVLSLLGSSKDKVDEHYGKLYQVDLAPTSKAKFDAFRAQTAFDVSRGKKTAEQAVMIRSTCSTVTQRANTWTIADFDYLPS